MFQTRCHERYIARAVQTYDIKRINMCEDKRRGNHAHALKLGKPIRKSLVHVLSKSDAPARLTIRQSLPRDSDRLNVLQTLIRILHPFFLQTS